MASLSDFTGLVETGDAYLADQWSLLVRAVQASTGYFNSQYTVGTPPNDHLKGIVFGDSGYVNRIRLQFDSTNFIIENNIGTDGAPNWSIIFTITPSGTVTNSKNLNVGDNAVGQDRIITVNARNTNTAGVKFQKSAVDSWQLSTNASYQFTVDDLSTGMVPLRIEPGHNEHYSINIAPSLIQLGTAVAPQPVQVNGALDVNGTSTLDGLVTAGAGLTASAGNIVATSGNITATAGNIVATSGNITATAGNIVATVGGVTAAGFVSSGYSSTYNFNSIQGSDYTSTCGNTADYHDIITGLNNLSFPGTADATKEYLVSLHLSIGANTTTGFAASDLVALLLGSPPALTGNTAWAGGTTVAHQSFVRCFDLGIDEQLAYDVSQVRIIPTAGQTLSVGYVSNRTGYKTGTGPNKVFKQSNSYVTIQRIK